KDGAVNANEPDPNDVDSDDDNITDGYEYEILRVLAYLRNNDSDGDGILDGDDLYIDGSGTWEPAWFIDFDGDGLVNALDTDSDNDGLLDGTEDINGNGKRDPGEDNPLDSDQDNDGANDGAELSVGLNNNNNDTDGDGILDGYEQDWNVSSDGDASVNALDTDSDDDGLLDNEEDKDLDGRFEPYGGDNGNETDPTKQDTDGDGLNDYDEVQNTTNPNSKDTDGDGLEDLDEILNYTTDPTSPFSDGDELTDGEEVRGDFGYITDPFLSDTDEDGFYDHEEIELGYNPLNPDMDGDGLIDGKDLQPLASFPDMYSAPPETRETLNFPVGLQGPEYDELLSYQDADDFMPTEQLAQVLDQTSIISPMLPSWPGQATSWAWEQAHYEAQIGSSIFSEDLYVYFETTDPDTSLESGVFDVADTLMSDTGYQVKKSPYIYTEGPWEYVGEVRSESFSRSKFTITFDNYRDVPAPGGFFHRLFKWELLPHANTISIQFGIDQAYDDSFSNETHFRLPGFWIHVYDEYTGHFDEVFTNIFAAKALGEHYYQVDMAVPPIPSGSLGYWTYVVDLVLVWVNRDTTGYSVEPLLPYRYRLADIEEIQIEGSHHSSAFGDLSFEQLDAVQNILFALNVTWSDLAMAGSVLDHLNMDFEDLKETGVIQFLESIQEELGLWIETDMGFLSALFEWDISNIDWSTIKAVAEEIMNLGLVVEDLLNLLEESGQHGIEDVSASVTVYAKDPIEIVSVSSITVVARHDTHIVLPKEHVDLDQAVSDFKGLSL
ncbi:MAG: hypothetical protein ACE5IO_08795, partial [Thermoplasmata archaeon]